MYPFEDLKQITNFELDEKLHAFRDYCHEPVLHYIFSILFAVGFYIQWTKTNPMLSTFLKPIAGDYLFCYDRVYSQFILVWRHTVHLCIYGFIIFFIHVQQKSSSGLSFLYLYRLPSILPFAILEALLALNPASTTVSHCSLAIGHDKRDPYSNFSRRFRS
jgi:uncharacterized protein